MTSPILKKITLIILLISLGSILSSGFFINLALNRQFQFYLSRVEEARETQTVEYLAEIYQENGGWPTQLVKITMGRANLGSLRYVTNIEDQVVIITRSGMKERRNEHLRSKPILVNGQPVGTAYFGANLLQDFLTRQNELFRVTINRSIFLSILFTGLCSFLVAFIFARKLSSPILEMNQIAKNMTTGNLATRVQNLPQDELGELGNSLNQLAERLQQVENLRKKMTADVAHDLRTPLATVQSHLEGMIDQVIPPSNENLESLLEEVKRLTTLIQDLQEIALADKAITQFHYEPLELQAFLADLIKKRLPLFRTKEIGLELKIANPLWLETDQVGLTKIMDNLLSNAFKYTPSGKRVTIEVTAEVTANEAAALIAVKDEGIGINATDLPFIFERFYRTDRSRNRESGGFGLGLTIVRDLVEALGGKVTAESTPDVGSVFIVKLPLVHHESNPN